MEEINITLDKVLSIGGKITEVKENGKTNSISITKCIKKNNISVKKGDTLCYLLYSDCSEVQAIFKIVKIKNVDSLKTLYLAYDKQ